MRPEPADRSSLASVCWQQQQEEEQPEEEEEPRRDAVLTLPVGALTQGGGQLAGRGHTPRRCSGTPHLQPRDARPRRAVRPAAVGRGAGAPIGGRAGRQRYPHPNHRHGPDYDHCWHRDSTLSCPRPAQPTGRGNVTAAT